MSALTLACGGQLAGSIDAGDSGPPQDATPPPTLDSAIDSSGGNPPGPPDGGAPTTTIETFAIHAIFFGETDRAGVPNNTAWRSYGYDIDGLATTATSTNVCTLTAGAPTTNQVDCNDGIDNAFGANILPILLSVSGNGLPSATQSKIIQSGASTFQIQVTGLSDDPSQNASGLSAQLFSSGAYDNGTPGFDTTTDWPVLASSLKDGSTISGGATLQFPNAYITDGTFVSGSGPAPLVVPYYIGNTTLPLTIHEPVVTFVHTSHTDVGSGTISGVLDTQELLAALKLVAGSISLSLCGSAVDGIEVQISQAQDILADGTNVQGVACSGISIGLGFTAKLVANPTKVAPPPAPPSNPCGN